MELDHDLENVFLSKSSNYRVMKFDFHACSPMSAANSFVLRIVLKQSVRMPEHLKNGLLFEFCSSGSTLRTESGR